MPVLIALIHDILITGGIYALAGAGGDSATVAAFLTILGYSMYDTIIVFDRIRENVPRMPRAAFSQIVNRSMSEVLTRSLITGLSTVFLVAMLLIFGDETLRGFAFAMMVGIASGTYSSIFIASPVLTEWKEREPAYRAPPQRHPEAMGYVPAFPEDNVVARVEGQARTPPAEPRTELVPRRARRARRGARRPAPAVAGAADAPEPPPEPPAPCEAADRRRIRRGRRHRRDRELREAMPRAGGASRAQARSSRRSAASTGGGANGCPGLVHRRARDLALHAC